MQIFYKEYSSASVRLSVKISVYIGFASISIKIALSGHSNMYIILFIKKQPYVYVETYATTFTYVLL